MFTNTYIHIFTNILNTLNKIKITLTACVIINYTHKLLFTVSSVDVWCLQMSGAGALGTSNFGISVGLTAGGFDTTEWYAAITQNVYYILE